MIAYVIGAILLVALIVLAMSVRILKQYERAVMFHLGKVRDGARGPGVIFFAPLINQVHRVSLRIVTMPIQSQGIITSDNVSIDVSAVAYYRVADPVRSVVAIQELGAFLKGPRARPASSLGADRPTIPCVAAMASRGWRRERPWRPLAW